MVVKFSGFSFDTEATKLHCGDRQVPLQLQPARVLAYLIEHRDRRVTRQELVRHLWPDTHVNFNQSLNYCVRRIRVALHEDTAAPKFFVTFPREGYRWIAPVESVGAAQSRTIGAKPPASNGLLTRPVPAWAAVALTGLFSTLAAWGGAALSTWQDRQPVDVAVEWQRPSNHLRLAIGALHTLSHALVEPARRAEGPGAVQTLWVLTTSHFGLSSDSDLR